MHRHSGENRNPYTLGEGQFLKFGDLWIPASAGMTKSRNDEIKVRKDVSLILTTPLNRRSQYAVSRASL